MSLNVETHEFMIPEKGVKQPTDIAEKWEKSEAYRDLLGFIGAMNNAVKNKKMRDEYHVSEMMEKLVSIMDAMSQWIDEIPPIDQPQRFGNKAYRDWFKRLQENANGLVRDALGEKYARAVDEVSVYLIESVGNSTRIDYGTGHELAFVAFMCCLYKIGALTESDAVATVFRLFARYLEVMRKLQLVYMLEPAGSQGVWCLDDYQFIPFIWGSSQLLDHPRLKPKSFPNPEICESFSKDYIFLGCIQHINKVKTGPFAEHSNQLWNISAVQLWSKVNSGLIKMYKAEVLSKFPAIQHFLFGSLLTLKPAT
ncbi:hypothetical protein CAPTEDRAFT_185148 [Capitella teleta]|uniref:Serine/threonine-protein phosphatase 2A activator n=1 Tax=Capitella teleta TaxID=283909 RepID=R7TNG1_CAPTE|nr:hypothetical protein CAPTEDRAFT_185148 [Capitella teleta]|eukprot:ELT93086.1 hypothetical protein CAPTEDRAFT_185148 [Capitella teleta]